MLSIGQEDFLDQSCATSHSVHGRPPASLAPGNSYQFFSPQLNCHFLQKPPLTSWPCQCHTHTPSWTCWHSFMVDSHWQLYLCLRYCLLCRPLLSSVGNRVARFLASRALTPLATVIGQSWHKPSETQFWGL